MGDKMIKAGTTDIENMQSILRLLRQTLDISVTEFADQLGVTRQTVYNIEKRKTKLTKTQYLAIFTIIEDAIKKQPDLSGIINAIIESGYNRLKVAPEDRNMVL